MDYINNIDVIRGKVEYFIHNLGKSMRLKREANIYANVSAEAKLINSLAYAIDELIEGVALDQTISYIISLIPDLDQVPVTPFNPVVMEIIPRSVVGGGSGSSVYAAGFEVTTIKAGSWNQGDFVEPNSDVRDVVKKMLQEIYQPTIINPTWSLSIFPGLIEIGVPTTINATWNYNQGTTGGEIETYYFNGTPGSTPDFDIQDLEAEPGLNEFSGALDIAEGPQLHDSDGVEVGVPRPAETVIATASVEGVYPIYADDVKQPLYSMINANSIVLDLLPESEGSKQDFEIPTLWLDSRPLAKVEFFNTVSGQWDLANKLANFSQAPGRSGYTKFTSTDPLRGAMKIKLTF